MKTKLFFTAIIICALALNANAQRFGIRGGASFPNMTHKTNGTKTTENMRVGMHIGAVGEYSITNMFALESGLLFDFKGAKSSTPGGTMKTNLWYLDIPVLAKVYYDVSDIKIYGAFGPVMGIGLTGKVKFPGTTNKIDWGDDVKRLNAGLLIGAGVEISDIQMGLSYDFGLTDINPGATKTKHQSLKLSATYYF